MLKTRPPTIRFLLAALALGVVVSGAGTGHATATCDKAWNNGTGGDWGAAGNWTPAGVPSDTETVCIQLAGTYTVTLSSSAAVKGITFGSDGNTGTATLQLQAGAADTVLTLTEQGNGSEGIRAGGKLVLETSTSPGTITTKISDANGIGDDPAIAIAPDGLPVIAHRVLGRLNDLGVTKCSNESCTSSTTTKISDVNRIGFENSIAIGTDGLPIIAHRDPDLDDLVVTKCANADCSSSNTTKIGDPNDIGFETSVAIGSDGLPVIAHLDTTDVDLVVTKCSDMSCTSSTTTKIVDANKTGHQPAIAIGADGLPVISHHDGTQSDLAVTKCSNLSCSSSSTTRIPDLDHVGDDTGIAIGTDGLPIVSYRDSTHDDLAVTKCGNDACTTGNTTTKIPHPNQLGRDTSIAIAPDGRPVIAHRDLGLEDLVITKCVDAACTGGNTTTWISDPDNTGKDAALAIGADGLPIIAHWDLDLNDLAVTKCGNAACSGGGDGRARVEVTAGTLSNDGVIDVINSGSSPGASFITSLENTAAAELRVRANATLALDSLANHSGQTLSGGRYYIAGALEYPGADIDHLAALVELDGPSSTISDDTSADALAQLASIESAGSLALRNGRNLTVPNQVTSAGTIDLFSGTTLDPDDSLTLSGGTAVLFGAGTVAGNVVNNGGLVQPYRNGTTLDGTLVVTGSFIQTKQGRLAVNIQGTGVGEHALLAITGIATLNGTLGIVPDYGSYVPAVGDSAEVVTHASKSGKVTASGLGQFLSNPVDTGWKVSTKATAVVLELVDTANLRTTKSDSADPVGANAPFSYTVVIENVASKTAKKAKLVDTFKPPLVLDGTVTTTVGSCAPPSAMKITCNFGDLGPGESATVMIPVKSTAAGAVKNTATVSSQTLDSVPEDNRDTETTTVNS